MRVARRYHGMAQRWAELQVRGPWVISAYYDDERNEESFSADGWFRTGDVITIDAEGYIQIVDRTKDLVKSGGEWISSLDLENTIMAHPRVLEAAVIAIPHERWQERPLAIVVAQDGASIREEIYALLRQRFAKWQLPDDMIFVEEIPKTSVGKFDKKAAASSFCRFRSSAGLALFVEQFAYATALMRAPDGLRQSAARWRAPSYSVVTARVGFLEYWW